MVRVPMAWTADADRSLPLPRYATDGAAGADLCANLPAPLRPGGLLLGPGMRALVPTGLRFAVPVGYEVQLRPRSGLALAFGLTLPNAPGTIDSDYRGPVGVLVQNGGETAVRIFHGMRIAQMVLAPVLQAEIEIVDDLDETGRGSGGFGSTGRAP